MPENDKGPGSTASDQRKTKGQRTRERILDAARKEFARLGYERATIRGIAAVAGVDKASVAQYFQTKQNLFQESVYWHIPIGELTSADPLQTAERYLQRVLSSWASTPDSPMAVLLRASMTSDDAARTLREHVASEVIDPIAENLETPDARLRAAVLACVMMGLASGRYLLEFPEVDDASIDDILRICTPLVERLISVDPE